MIRRPTLLAIALALVAAPAFADQLDHLGTFTWESEDVVGLSALDLKNDGISFQAVGDRGWFLEGTLQREDGQIAGVSIDRLLPILGSSGLPVAARRVGDLSDAEGLAVAPDGSYWISFERWARVARFASPDAAAEWIRDHPTFAEFPDNRQLEALALSPDGRLFAFSERPTSTGFPIFRLDGATWVIDGHITPDNRFAIVGADFADDGRLFLLERRLILGIWWRSRIRVLDIDQPDQIDVLWTSRAGEFDNLEGISLWVDAEGLRITLVSDNNANKSEPTQFIEFRLSPTTAN